MKVFALLLILLALPFFVEARDYDLNWKINSTNENGFVVLERFGSGNAEWNVLAVTQPKVSAYKVKTPGNGTRVCWRVAAYNKAGASQASNPSCQKD